MFRKAQETLHATAERILPPLKSSALQERGVLTPREFVSAGDALVRACPTWHWEAGDAGMVKSYLPVEKQFLITKSVPCLHRTKQDVVKESMLREEEMDDGFVGLHMEQEEIIEAERLPVQSDVFNQGMRMEEASTKGWDAAAKVERCEDDEDNLPDLEDFDPEENILISGEIEEEDDEALAPCDNVLRTRTYDVFITYDKYYSTPRAWLIGYDVNRRLLTQEEMMEDISESHAGLTVAVEQHPHLPIKSASFHPCKHAKVMLRLGQATETGLDVQSYLFLFLKFLAAVVPNIEYDFTVAADASLGHECRSKKWGKKRQ